MTPRLALSSLPLLAVSCLLTPIAAHGGRHFPHPGGIVPPPAKRSALRLFWAERRAGMMPPAMPLADQDLVFKVLLQRLRELPRGARPTAGLLLAVATTGRSQPQAVVRSLLPFLARSDASGDGAKVLGAAMLGLAMAGEPSWKQREGERSGKRRQVRLILESLVRPERPLGVRWLGRLGPKAQGVISRQAVRCLGALAAHPQCPATDRWAIAEVLIGRWRELRESSTPPSKCGVDAAGDWRAVLDAISMVPTAGGDATRKGLVRLLTRAWDRTDQPTWLRADAVRALGLLFGRGQGAARQHFKFRCEQLLAAPEKRLREASIRALEAMCTDGEADRRFRLSLGQSAGAEDPMLRVRALAALASAGGPEAAEFLIKQGTTAKSSFDRGAAGLALGIFWGRTSPPRSPLEKRERSEFFRAQVRLSGREDYRFGWTIGWSLVDPEAAWRLVNPPYKPSGPGRAPPPHPWCRVVVPPVPENVQRLERTILTVRPRLSSDFLCRLARLGGMQLPGGVGSHWPANSQDWGGLFDYDEPTPGVTRSTEVEPVQSAPRSRYRGPGEIVPPAPASWTRPVGPGADVRPSSPIGGRSTRARRVQRKKNP